MCFHPSPDFTHVLASGSKDSSVWVWDWKEAEELKRLKVGQEGIIIQFYIFILVRIR